MIQTKKGRDGAEREREIERKSRRTKMIQKDDRERNEQQQSRKKSKCL